MQENERYEGYETPTSEGSLKEETSGQIRDSEKNLQGMVHAILGWSDSFSSQNSEKPQNILNEESKRGSNSKKRFPMNDEPAKEEYISAHDGHLQYTSKSYSGGGSSFKNSSTKKLSSTELDSGKSEKNNTQSESSSKNDSKNRELSFSAIGSEDELIYGEDDNDSLESQEIVDSSQTANKDIKNDKSIKNSDGSVKASTGASKKVKHSKFKFKLFSFKKKAPKNNSSEMKRAKKIQSVNKKKESKLSESVKKVKTSASVGDLNKDNTKKQRKWGRKKAKSKKLAKSEIYLSKKSKSDINVADKTLREHNNKYSSSDIKNKLYKQQSAKSNTSGQHFTEKPLKENKKMNHKVELNEKSTKAAKTDVEKRPKKPQEKENLRPPVDNRLKRNKSVDFSKTKNTFDPRRELNGDYEQEFKASTEEKKLPRVQDYENTEIARGKTGNKSQNASTIVLYKSKNFNKHREKGVIPGFSQCEESKTILNNNEGMYDTNLERNEMENRPKVRSKSTKNQHAPLVRTERIEDGLQNQQTTMVPVKISRNRNSLRQIPRNYELNDEQFEEKAEENQETPTELYYREKNAELGRCLAYDPVGNVENAISYFQFARNQNVVNLELKIISGIFSDHYDSYVSNYQGNAIRNRDKDSVPYDYNRVKVMKKLIEDTDVDYICASFISNPSNDNIYIMTQSPMQDTAASFWSVVYERKVKMIFSFVDFNNFERGIHRYLPKKNNPLDFQNFVVFRIQGRKLDKAYKLRRYKIVLKKKGSPPFKFDHYHMKLSVAGCMRSIQELDSMIDIALEYYESDQCTGPIMVHCYNGNELSPVFIGSLILREHIRECRMFSPLIIAMSIRKQLMNCFSKPDSYVLLYRLLANYISRVFNIDRKLLSLSK